MADEGPDKWSYDIVMFEQKPTPTMTPPNQESIMELICGGVYCQFMGTC